ncbi:unnamed protein product [Paramecium sonneborni]|uniref:WD domain, G-beta repeat protein n=1 Tax=Paramecium sonneborni TaxID=65129 RepID=A0A8S1RHM2_9CILI|nr:unnamed protein product [Paramecium sonneborni]
MIQQQMIELGKQLNCRENHNQPIHMVIFDKKLKGQESLLCNICMETFESDSKMIGFKKVLQMIEDNQNSTVDNIQKVIQVDLDLIEQFQNELHTIKSSIINQLDQVISYFENWIKSLNQIKKFNSQYSFYDELELLINNTSKQEQIRDSIKALNNSYYSKINLQLSNLKNLELQSQCDKYLQNWNLSHQIQVIDNSIKQAAQKYQITLIDDSITQSNQCNAISFNSSGSLMISASNKDIKVWNFDQGKLKEITTLKAHTENICCLLFSQKSNSFISAGGNNSIRCWKQINEKKWKSSLSYEKHSQWIKCLILNQSEKELFSGGDDYSIKIWSIDLIQNELTYLYSLDQHTGHVYSLCFNQSENILASCGGDNQIIIWNKDNKQKWQFMYVVTQTIQESGCRLCFINDNQFIWVTGKDVSNDCISIFQLRDGKYQENLDKQVQLIKNDQIWDCTLYPIFYNKEKSLMIVRHKFHVYLIKISNDGQLNIITQMQYKSNSIQGALSNDGRYLVNWNKYGKKFDINEILIN